MYSCRHTLGPDIDDRAEAWLREVAENRRSNLNPAAESLAVALSMSKTRPQLLLDLAELHYIEQPDPSRPWDGMGALDDGIRDFQPALATGSGAAGSLVLRPLLSTPELRPR